MRFAILTHDHPFLHWDLLLEAGAACRSWRVLAEPAGTGPWPLEPLPEHRLFYLDYAGPVSGGRGAVTPWDAGHLDWITALPDRVVAHVAGERWSGQLTLSADAAGGWTASLVVPSMSRD